MELMGWEGATVRWREASMGESGAVVVVGLQRASMSPMGVLMDEKDALAMEGLWRVAASLMGALTVKEGIPACWQTCVPVIVAAVAL